LPGFFLLKNRPEQKICGSGQIVSEAVAHSAAAATDLI
jgi:hypothetical protein